MSYLKRRISMFLSVLVVFTTMFCALPQEKVQAASKTTYLNWDMASVEGLIVQKGVDNFYIGDYASAGVYGVYSYTYYPYVSLVKSVTYSSSNTKVATVNSKGKVTAKAAGTTTLKIKYKGKTISTKLQVESSLASYNSTVENLSRIKTETTSFIKTYGSGITTKNRYTILSAYNRMKDLGYFNASTDRSTVIGGKTYTVICAPSSQHARALASAVNNYGSEKNPFGTKQSKEFNVSSISGKSKTITVNLSKAVTADQIFGVQYANGWDTLVAEKKTVKFPIYIEDVKTNHSYYAIASVTKGSKKMKITTTNLTLKKGKSYKLETGTSRSWLLHGKITFKAK